MNRLRTIRALVGPEVRAMNVVPLAGSALLTTVIVVLTGYRARDLAGALPVALAVAAIGLCFGSAFAFDDPAADSIASVPTSLLVRRALRLGMTALAVGAVWGALALFVRLRVEAGVPLGVLSLAFLAMLSFTLAVAAFTGNSIAEGWGGLYAGPALLVALGLSRVLPPRWRFFETTSDDYSASLRFGVVIGVCLLAIVWASLDPGRRVNRLRLRIRQGL